MKNKNESPGLFQGIMLAHLILVLHLLLLMGIGVVIIFFRGIMAYLPLIMISGLAVIGGLIYYLFRRLKAQGKSLRDVLNLPLFSGKSVEIRLLGGIASIKIDSRPDGRALPEAPSEEHLPLPGDQETSRSRELIELARAFEKNRIDPIAPNKAGRKLFK